MSKSRFQRKFRTICLSILICSLLISSGLDMAVICHAENGHTAIEAATTAGCALTPLAHSDETCPLPTESGISSTDDCGDCLDIFLSIGHAVIAKDFSKTNSALSAPIMVADKAANPPDFVQPLSISELILSPPCSTHLESVVMLI